PVGVSSAGPPAKPYWPIWPRLSAVRSREAITPRVMSTTAVASSTRPMSAMMITAASDLDFDDLLDCERPGNGPSRGQDENDPAAQRGRERMEVARVLELDGEDHDDGQRRHDPPRHASLHRQRLDQPLQVEALPNGSGDGVDHLGGISAGLPLQLGDERQ